VIGRTMFSHNIFVKPRPRVDAKYAGDTASHTADHSADGRADWAGRRITRGGAFCRTTWNALRLRRANPERDENGRYRHCVFQRHIDRSPFANVCARITTLQRCCSMTQATTVAVDTLSPSC
jgi:hypothetical protein